MLLEAFDSILFVAVMFGIVAGMYFAVAFAMWLFDIVVQVVIWGFIMALKIIAIINLLYERLAK